MRETKGYCNQCAQFTESFAHGRRCARCVNESKARYRASLKDRPSRPVPITPPSYRKVVQFTLQELAFFLGGRTWEEIDSRFLPGRPRMGLLNSILSVDCDGGIGHLDWDANRQVWFLTEEGLVFICTEERAAS